MPTHNKQKMHIALITDAWLPQVNGVVRSLQTTIKHLEGRGHKVTPITPLDFKTIPCPTYPEIRLAIFCKSRVWALLDNMQPDCIHIATEGPIGFAARSYCLKHGLPFTTAFHTRFPEYVAARSPIPESWGYKFMNWFHRPSQAVMVPSQSMIECLTENGFTNAALWSRGVDLSKFNTTKSAEPAIYKTLKRPIAICTGRVAVEKNLEAFLGMDFDGSKVIVGDGPARAELEAKYPDVTFTGKLSDEDMVAHLQNADIFTFPSKSETFGNVVTEALACGLPVAAFDVTGPKDILGRAKDVSKVGALAKNGSSNALALATKEALKTADRAACRAHAETFSWESVTDQFVSHLAPITDQDIADMKQAS